jgi:dTMP kinase
VIRRVARGAILFYTSHLENRLRDSGVFITFEGLDGCGKTTQMELQVERLRGRGLEVLGTKEPGGTAVGQQIRDIVLNAAIGPVSAPAELALMSAARAQHLCEVINPAIAAGKLVLCDRFMDSTIAYQGYGRGLSMDMIYNLHALLCNKAKPDLTIYLDISPETAAARTASRNLAAHQPTTRFEYEGIDFFRRVHCGYMDIAAREPQRFRMLDGTGTVDQVQQAVSRTIDAFLAGTKT